MKHITKQALIFALVIALLGGILAGIEGVRRSRRIRPEDLEGQETAEEIELPELTGEEKIFLDQLMLLAGTDRFEDGGRLLEENREIYMSLREKMYPQGIVYDGNAPAAAFTGKGAGMTCGFGIYIGDYIDSIPGGQGMTITIPEEGEEGIIFFAKGNWEMGGLQGQAITGFLRPAASGNQAERYEILGGWSRDRGDGDMIQTSYYKGGKQAWKILVDDGVVKIGDDWTFEQTDDGKGKYKLHAFEGKGYMVIPGSRLDEASVYNRSPWTGIWLGLDTKGTSIQIKE